MLVYRSNRLEVLADALADVLATPLPDPMARETVVVLSQGMERWLKMQLAQRLGVAANIDMPFPAKVVRLAFEGALEATDTAAWGPLRMTFAVLGVLPELLPLPLLAPVRSYLEGEPRGGVTSRRRLLLARRIAEVFDRYLTYRPEMIRRWDDPSADQPEDGWQPLLFRAVRDRLGARHLPALEAELARAMAAEGATPAFPSRIIVFGVTALPPFYLDVLASVARRTEIHLFVFCPSQKYWGDIRSRREIARELRRSGQLTAEGMHLEEGNPLLASLGRLGRDFQVQLESVGEREPYLEPRDDLFRDPGCETMLSALQSDILQLHHRGAKGGPAPLPLAPTDRSVAIHACHGPLRQVEVLRDELLALLSADESLEPRDIVVMTPDIEGYAPLIEAVFSDGSDGDDGDVGFPRIPFRIADRSLRHDNPLASALVQLLELSTSRMTAPEVLDLVSLEPVRRRFGIEARDMTQIVEWVRTSGIRWGIAAAHRERHVQPPYSENTWRFGLDRMLLGHAMTGDGDRMVAGVLPFDGVEGTVTGLLGRFVDLCEALFATLAELRGDHPLSEWRDRLFRALDALLLPDDATAWQRQQVRDTLNDLVTEQEAAKLEGTLDLPALLALLTGALERSPASSGFLTGEVTFCALVPMRSIPFRVVCLLGMDDGAFPRATPRLGYDLVAQRPMLGDRSPREDDRTLFLEALLAARERLLVTYSGRGVRDNKERPPAVPVVELLDVLCAQMRPPDGVDTGDSPAAWVRRRLLTEHPLQPFSPRCFGVTADGKATPPQSHDHRALRGARRLLEPKEPPRPFFAGPLPEEEGAGTIELRELVRFFQGPTGYLLSRRLGIVTTDDAVELLDREPLDVAGLDRYAVSSSVLERRLAGSPTEAVLPVLRASGRLPLGTPGSCLLEDISDVVEPVVETLAGLRVGDRREPVLIELEIGGRRLTGRVGDLWASGQVQHQVSRVGARHLLGLWVRHLALTASGDPSFSGESHLVGRAEKGDGVTHRVLAPVADAATQLASLVDLFLTGRRGPVPLFPETSMAYAAVALEAPDDPATVQKARDKASSKWQSDFGVSEGDTAEVVRVYGGAGLAPWDPAFLPPLSLAPRFEEVALLVFGPLLDHLDEGGQP